ncbi:MAG: hypothetical protein ABJD13_12115 [Paracoccaceae bacterium]
MHLVRQQIGDLDAPAVATWVGCKTVEATAAVTLKAALRVIFGLVMFDTPFGQF